jgi:hypothetical protein
MVGNFKKLNQYRLPRPLFWKSATYVLISEIANRVKGSGSNQGKCRLLLESEKICKFKWLSVIAGSDNRSFEIRGEDI